MRVSGGNGGSARDPLRWAPGVRAAVLIVLAAVSAAASEGVGAQELLDIVRSALLGPQGGAR